MASEKDQKKLEELRSKVKKLKEEREALNAKLRSRRDSVMGFYNEIDKLLKEAKKYKDERDAANKKVSDLKEKRDKDNAKIAELNKKISELRGEEEGVMSRRDYEKCKSDYDKLNWRMQTSPVGKGKEEAMVRQLEELELKIKEHEMLKPTSKEAVKLEKELKDVRKEADGYHSELLKVSDDGEKAHAEMHEIYKKVDERRNKAKKSEEGFLEMKREVDEAHQRFVDALNELRALEDKLGIKRARERKVSDEKLKKEQKETEGNLLEELKKGGVIKTDDLLVFQDKK